MSLVKENYNAYQRQGYEIPFLFQVVPVMGAIISIPIAVISAATAIKNVVQAIFEKIVNGKPFFRPEEKEQKKVKFPLEDAKDHGIIFANSVANICTLGFLNCGFALSSLDGIVLRKNVRDL